MTITHRQKPSGSTLSAVTNADGGGSTPKYHCDACSNDVTNTVRIRCADKDCPDFDLCVSCFCGGAEPVKHKTWHDYHEELLLIEAAEKMGIGNWQAIADYVGECEQHYLDVYVSSPNWPLPRMNLKFETSEVECRERKRQRLQQSRGMTPRKPMSGPSFHEIQGYMPRRFEFETEYENDAEQFVKDMVFNDDDTEEEVDLKVMVLDIYNSRLDPQNLIFERRWLDFKRMQAIERKRQKEERDIYNKTRVFCRLQTEADYDMFVKGLVKEQQLRDRIATLQEWRQAGLTTIRQGEQYEREKQNRLAQLKTFVSLSSERTGSSGSAQRNTYRQQMASLAASNGANYYRDRPTHSASTPTPTNTAAAPSGGRKPANPLNIRDADGVHLLTEEEQVLCSTLRIMPRPYLVIKDTILKEYARLGYLKRRQCRSLIKIDVNKTSRIYDFFVESGWIKAFKDPATASAAATCNSTYTHSITQLYINTITTSSATTSSSPIPPPPSSSSPPATAEPSADIATSEAPPIPTPLMTTEAN
ncbi:Homeodomain-like DNA binding domain-containing transcription factor [Mucor lusitanicus]